MLLHLHTQDSIIASVLLRANICLWNRTVSLHALADHFKAEHLITINALFHILLP